MVELCEVGAGNEEWESEEDEEVEEIEEEETGEEDAAVDFPDEETELALDGAIFSAMCSARRSGAQAERRREAVAKVRRNFFMRGERSRARVLEY